MSRTMIDACNPAHIPRSAVIVAGYIYGNCAWPAWAWALFPNARHVRIATVQTINDGQVLDVERGDATPDQAPGWCARARQRGQLPTVYTSVDNWQACRDAFALHGVPEPLWWIAHYGVAPVLPAGAIALQYVNEQPPGCDSSIVADYWPGVDPVPATSPQGEPMHLFTLPGVGGIWLLFETAGKYIPVDDGADVTSYQHSGATGPEPISEVQHQRHLAAFATTPDVVNVTSTG